MRDIRAASCCVPCPRVGWHNRMLRYLLLLFLLPLVASCSTTRLAPQHYGLWHFWHRGEVRQLSQYLEGQGVSDVLPAAQLLRSASSWEECDADFYGVPPRERWEAVASVLRLLGFLEASGVLVGEIEVYSGYRSPALNACAGGAAGSAHASSFALDFRVPGMADPAKGLCDFWRTQGKAWNMGFAVYPSGRIHIDTAGYRTWGYDHTSQSAVCQ